MPRVKDKLLFPWPRKVE